MWKIRDFSYTRILREINFGEFGVSKMLHLEKFKTFRVIKIAALKILIVPQLISHKIVNFGFSMFSKLPFSLLKIGQTCGNGQFEPLHFAKLVNSKIFKGLFTFRALYLIFLFRTFQKR